MNRRDSQEWWQPATAILCTRWHRPAGQTCSDNQTPRIERNGS